MNESTAVLPPNVGWLLLALFSALWIGLLAAIGNGDQMAYVVAQRLISADDPSGEAVFVKSAR